MIVIKNISKSYYKGKENEQLVLNGISLEIKKGEMVAVMGKSGSGKSTLLHVMGLLDKFDSGEYFLNDKDVSKMSDKEKSGIRNDKIGYVVQDFALIDGENVKNNIELPAVIAGEKNKRDLGEILELVGLKGYEKKLVNKLSGGEKQRVAIGRALINNPDIIMADEPTGNLDVENGNRVMTLFKKLNEEGKTIILITHDEEIAKQCGRIIYVRDGKIIE